MRIWDAQIWATARLNQIPVVLSEDFSDGAVIEGIRIVNPFTVSFQARDWVR
jgi:predicted nucleic acid-binding protein